MSSGTLTITEYSNMGDTAPSMLLEPATRAHRVAFGEVSEELQPGTRIVGLYSDLPCRFQFITDGQKPDEKLSTPMREEYEISRLVHMGTGLRVAAFDAG
jgi:hypothetical protein